MKRMNIKWLFTVMISLIAFSCAKDDAAPAPIASFQYEADASDFLTINFTNFSTNATSFSWNFGDGSAASTDKDPIHAFAATGTYSVTLTATSAQGTSTKTEDVNVVDPDEALTLLAGVTSKEWKLYRVGDALALGPNATSPDQYFALGNADGKRPCLFTQTFTFKRDGSFVYDDKGVFWGENDPFLGTANHETCFVPSATTMLNKDGANVAAWGSGTHAFTYNSAASTVTLNGMGAWMGFVHTVGAPNYSNIPTATRTFDIDIESFVGYDVMTISYTYTDLYWSAKYVNYTDASLEPAIIDVPPGFGVDLPNITPTAMSHSFASTTGFVQLGAISGASTITLGVDDPTNAANPKVGQFNRTADQFQEAKFQVSPDLKDITFTSLTTVKVDVYLPSTNNYTTLTKKVIIGLADPSQTEQWWTNLIQYESADLPLDTWTTVTFTLNTPSFSSVAGQKPNDRTDLDMVFLQIGGGGHSVTGTFYVKNLRFEP